MRGNSGTPLKPYPWLRISFKLPKLLNNKHIVLSVQKGFISKQVKYSGKRFYDLIAYSYYLLVIVIFKQI